MDPSLHDFRPRAARLLAALGAVALAPFAIADLVLGRPIIAIAMLALSATLLIGVWQLTRGRYHPLLVLAVFGAPAIVVNAVGAAKTGVMGTYWTYVIVLAYYLVLPRRWAGVLAAILAAVMVPFAWQQFGAELGSRYLVTLALVSLFAHVTVGLIDDRERRLVEQMERDPLTGLLNRATLSARLVAASATAQPASLLALDVDHFKSINDRFGHETGDRVLVGLASLVRRHVRSEAPVFRLGGEEFLVMLEGAGVSDAERAAERVLHAVAASDLVDGHVVTVSIGVAEREPDETIHRWLQRADEALYRAKDAGRNRLSVA